MNDCTVACDHEFPVETEQNILHSEGDEEGFTSKDDYSIDL